MKYCLLHDHLIASGLTTDAELLRPQICPNDILVLAHDRAYIERYMNGELSREDQRRLGLPWSEALARRHGILHHSAQRVLDYPQ